MLAVGASNGMNGSVHYFSGMDRLIVVGRVSAFIQEGLPHFTASLPDISHVHIVYVQRPEDNVDLGARFHTSFIHQGNLSVYNEFELLAVTQQFDALVPGIDAGWNTICAFQLQTDGPCLFCALPIVKHWYDDAHAAFLYYID